MRIRSTPGGPAPMEKSSRGADSAYAQHGEAGHTKFSNKFGMF